MHPEIGQQRKRRKLTSNLMYFVFNLFFPFQDNWTTALQNRLFVGKNKFANPLVFSCGRFLREAFKEKGENVIEYQSTMFHRQIHHLRTPR